MFSLGFFAGSLQGSLAVRRGVLCRVLARFPMGFIFEFSQGFSVVLRPSGVGVLQGSLGGSPGSPWDSLLSQGFPQGSRPSLQYLHLESTRLPPNFWRAYKPYQFSSVVRLYYLFEGITEGTPMILQALSVSCSIILLV